MQLANIKDTPVPDAGTDFMEGPEDLRLRTKLRPDERLALRREVTIQADGSNVRLTSPDGESVLEVAIKNKTLGGYPAGPG